MKATTPNNNANWDGINALTLTPGEHITLIALIDCLYAEAGFSDVDLQELSRYTGIKIASLKGHYGSLCKKGICESEDEFGTVNLRMKYWYLHNSWKAEYDAHKEWWDR